jgi:hypothetical protein
MVTLTKGPSEMERQMDMEYSSGQVVASMKESGRIIGEKARALTITQMAESM